MPLQDRKMHDTTEWIPLTKEWSRSEPTAKSREFVVDNTESSTWTSRPLSMKISRDNGVRTVEWAVM